MKDELDEKMESHKKKWERRPEVWVITVVCAVLLIWGNLTAQIEAVVVMAVLIAVYIRGIPKGYLRREVERERNG